MLFASIKPYQFIIWPALVKMGSHLVKSHQTLSLTPARTSTHIHNNIFLNHFSQGTLPQLFLMWQPPQLRTTAVLPQLTAVVPKPGDSAPHACWTTRLGRTAAHPRAPPASMFSDHPKAGRRAHSWCSPSWLDPAWHLSETQAHLGRASLGRAAAQAPDCFGAIREPQHRRAARKLQPCVWGSSPGCAMATRASWHPGWELLSCMIGILLKRHNLDKVTKWSKVVLSFIWAEIGSRLPSLLMYAFNALVWHQAIRRSSINQTNSKLC